MLTEVPAAGAAGAGAQQGVQMAEQDEGGRQGRTTEVLQDQAVAL